MRQVTFVYASAIFAAAVLCADSAHAQRPHVSLALHVHARPFVESVAGDVEEAGMSFPGDMPKITLLLYYGIGPAEFPTNTTGSRRTLRFSKAWWDLVEWRITDQFGNSVNPQSVLTFEDAKLSDSQSSGTRPTNGESLAENVMATASFAIRGPHRGALRFTARLPVMAPEKEPQTVTSAAPRIVFYEGDESPRVRVAYLRARVDELEMPRQFGDLKRLVMEIVAITPADFTAWERLADASLGIAPLEETRNYYARAAEIVARNLTKKPENSSRCFPGSGTSSRHSSAPTL